MIPPRPWTPESLARLGVGLLLCLFAGATLIGATDYNPASARLAAPWFFLLLGACIGAYFGVFKLLLGDWTVEGFAVRAAVLCALLFVSLNAGLAIAKLGGTPPEPPRELARILLAIATFQGGGLCLVTWFLRRNGMNWAEAFGLRHAPARAVGQGFALGLLALPVLLGLQALCVAGLSRIGWNPQPQSLVEIFERLDVFPGQIVLGFSAVILAPVSEEVLFRGLFYPALKQFNRPLVALGLSSVIFGAFHVHLPSFLPLTLFAVVLVVLRDRTQNLLAPITAHATFNLANVLAMLFWPTPPPVSP